MALATALRKNDFQQKTNITSPPTLSPILDVAVPRGQAWMIPHNEPFELVVASEHTETPNQNGAYEFEIPGGFMKPPHISDDLAFKIYDTVANQYLTLDYPDFTAGTIRVLDAVSGNECKVFFPMKSGLVRISLVVSGMGMGALSVPLLQRTMTTIHGVDQYLATSPLKIREAPGGVGGQFGGWVVPETWRVQVQLKDSRAVTVDPRATNYHIWLPYRHTSILEMPDGYEQNLVQMALTGGGRV